MNLNFLPYLLPKGGSQCKLQISGLQGHFYASKIIFIGEYKFKRTTFVFDTS